MFKHTVLTGTFGGRANSIYNCPNPEPVTESIDLLLHPNLNVDEDNVVYLRQSNQSHADGRPHWGEGWRYIYFWRTHGGVFVEYGDANTRLGPLIASKGGPEGMGQHTYGGDPVLLPNKCIISDVPLLQRVALEFLRDCEKAPAIVEWLPDAMISPEDDRWERFAVRPGPGVHPNPVRPTETPDGNSTKLKVAGVIAKIAANFTKLRLRRW